MDRILGFIPRRVLPWALWLLFAASPVAAGDETTLIVRVMEATVADRVTVGAPAPLRCTFAGGPLTVTRLNISAEGSSGLRLETGEKTLHVASPVTIVPVSGPILTVTVPGDAHRYRGALTVSSQEGVIVLLNAVPLEDYLLSVVPGELDTRQPAALEAQAILCRTFALKNRRRHTGWDLCDLTHCQHYGGVDTETAVATRAVRMTERLIVTYGGKPAEVFYHSSSGGMTASPTSVWGGPAVAYLVPVRDVLGGRELSAASPDFSWSFTVEKKRLLAALSDAFARPVTGVAVHDRDASGRAAAIRLSGTNTKVVGEDFRNIVCSRFGWGSLKSTLFKLHEKGGSYRFDGKGLGHGVGMSQWGAVELARMGKDYRQIIEFYFPGTSIEAADR